jgi:molecular chaperone IbpA
MKLVNDKTRMMEVYQMLIGLGTEDLKGVQRPSYPPYDIIKLSEDSTRISVAVAGFSKSELNVTLDKNRLNVSGQLEKPDEAEIAKYVHRGIARRKFSLPFVLAEYVNVLHVELIDGILHINLARQVPEELKPKSFTIY